MLKKRVKIKYNKEKLIISTKFFINFKNGKYNGVFEFGGDYKNQLKVSDNTKTSIVKRVFSPPDNENLSLRLVYKKTKRTIKFKKDNCFKNFFTEVLKIIKNKKYNYYYKRMNEDLIFRSNFIKKIV
tara:strand:- start:280 stop:660 length:381 start_codon:yes stop_codon:yes gene_type:complete